MGKTARGPMGRATVEACNALKAETFRKLPDEIELWRFREVLFRLGRYLGLSDGAVSYAIDIMGLLTEADWRGDGRPVTYHSIRSYARKVQKNERTIGNYEAKLIDAGLAHRTIKHARRHGGQGRAERRTGLDWRAFGVEMPNLLKRLEERNIHDARCLDLEHRIRSETRLIRGLAPTLGEGRAEEIEDQLIALGASPLRACLCVHELEPILASLALLRATLSDEMDPVEPNNTLGDNDAIEAQESEQSESFSGLKDDTINSSSPSEKRICFEWKRSGERRRSGPTMGEYGEGSATKRKNSLDAIPLPEIWKAAPKGWKTPLGQEVEISWPVLIEIAGHMAHRLEVSAYAWNQALRVLGPSQAALALLVLDRNRDHPARPVLSVGGALVGMTRRAEEGDFTLTPSIYGIMNRKAAAGSGDRHAAW